MILVDTSIWADHFRQHDATLARLLEDDYVFMHPFVIGEIMMGNPVDRAMRLSLLRRLPKISVASDDEVLHLVEQRRLFGSGIGYIDAHLLASVQIAGNAKFWTRDRRLARAAEALGTISDLPVLH